MSVDPGIVLDVTHAAAVDWKAVLPETRRARERLEDGSGPGSELTGWLDLPTRVAADELARYAAYVMTKGNTKSSPRVVEAEDVETFLKSIL